MISDKNLIEIQISNHQAKPWYYFLSKLFLWLLKRDLKAIKKEERIKANKKQKCFADPSYCDLRCLCKEALEKRNLPNCKCSNVEQCDTWCIAKENYSSTSKYGHE